MGMFDFGDQISDAIKSAKENSDKAFKAIDAGQEDLLKKISELKNLHPEENHVDAKKANELHLEIELQLANQLIEASKKVSIWNIMLELKEKLGILKTIGLGDVLQNGIDLLKQISYGKKKATDKMVIIKDAIEELKK